MKILLLSPSVFMSPRFTHLIFAPRDLAVTLVDGLVGRGHQVTFATTADSKTKAKVLPGDEELIKLLEETQKKPDRFITYKVRMLAAMRRDYEIDLITRAIKETQKHKYDLVHIYHKDMAHYFDEYFRPIPTVYTLHDPVATNGTLGHNLYSKFQNHTYISISDAQQRSGDLKLNFMGTCYHGLDLRMYKLNKDPGNTDYFAFIGRMVPLKGLEDALKVVNKLGLKLRVATSRADVNIDNTFYRRIRSHFRSNYIVHAGFLRGEKKSEFYEKAQALLFPIKWEEPFGMVMIEAMACGTPVIAYNRGSVAEIVKDGVTGFIIDPDDENRPGKGGWVIKKRGLEGLAEAARRIGEIDRNACRQHVEERFTLEHMVGGYEKMYENAISHNKNSLNNFIYEGSSRRF